MDEQFAAYTELAVGYGLNILYALIVLIVGFWIAGMVRRGTRRAMARTSRIDVTVASFLSGAAYYLVLAVVLIAVLQLFGVETTSLIAVLGAASLAVGLALQGMLSNVAAGVMILIFRPFKIGDYITAGGESGTVKDINLFITELATPDNVQILVPNGDAWGSAITNYSAHPVRRVDITIGIDYGDDPAKAIELISGLVAADERAHKEPEPFIALTNLGDSSVDITLRVWAASADYWALKFDLTRRIKEAFDANGISIPFPHMTLVQAAAGDAADK